jgi:hypothetical protein
MKFGIDSFIGRVLLSLFIGFVVFALPISLIPAATRAVTLPLICKDGTYKVDSYSNGDNDFSIDYCVNPAGEKQDITGLVLLVPGLISSTLIFIVLFIWPAIISSIVGRLRSLSGT